MKQTTRLPIRLASIVVAMLVVLAACSGGNDDAGTSEDAFFDVSGGVAAEAPGDFDESMAEEGRDAESAENGSDADGIDEVAVQVRQAARQIIFTADLVVAVTDVAASEAEASRIIEDLDGFLFGQQSVGLPEPTSILTFKIEPDRFQEALDRLGDIGEVRSQNVSADDVTDRIVDLESRIATAETSVERLRELLSDANSVEAIAALEGQLLQRETELESMPRATADPARPGGAGHHHVDAH